MNKELNITEEEYKEINAEDDDSIIVNTKNLGRVSLIKSKFEFFSFRKNLFS